MKSNTSYTIMSGASKLFALTITYPYQVVRSRIQVCLISVSVQDSRLTFPCNLAALPEITEQRYRSTVPYYPSMHKTYLGRRRFSWLLPRVGHQSCPRSPRNVCNFRCLRKPRLAPTHGCYTASRTLVESTGRPLA